MGIAVQIGSTKTAEESRQEPMPPVCTSDETGPSTPSSGSFPAASLATGLLGLFVGKNTRRENVQAVLRQLHSINANSEEDFLQIGEDLQATFRATLELDKAGQEASNLMGGQEIEQNINMLDELTAQVRRDFANFEQQITQNQAVMLRISNCLPELDRPLRGMEQSVLTPRMLGIATRIESSRIQSDDNSLSFWPSR